MNERHEGDRGLEASDLRTGEIAFPPEGLIDGSARLRIIGSVRSPWQHRGDCPKNVRQARERTASGALEIASPYRQGLRGLRPGQWVLLLTWLHQARRDLALQMPRHADAPSGTFSLRSPVRPNPIGLHLVRILELDEVSGIVAIDAVDVLDETPLLDIKPYLKSVDMPPTASD